MSKSSIILLIIALATTSSCYAEKSWYTPDYIKMQHAGYIGYLSIGLGKKIESKNLEVDLFYGYVPEDKSGIEIHTTAIKLTHFPAIFKTPMFTDVDSFYSFTLLHPNGSQYGYRNKGGYDFSLTPLVFDLGMRYYPLTFSRNKTIGLSIAVGTTANWMLSSLFHTEPSILFDNVSLSFGFVFPFH